MQTQNKNTKNAAALVRALLVTVFTLAIQPQKKPDDQEKNKTTYTVAILNEEEKRRKAANPSKPGQKRKFPRNFNNNTAIKMANSKPLGASRH